MSEKRARKDAVEVASQPIQDELAAIKDRLSAIETIQSISNAQIVKQYVQEHLKTKDAKKLMRECESSKSRSDLQTSLNYNSKQALDHHLKPLREADLIRQKVESDGSIVFEWSNLFRRLPKSAIKSILDPDAPVKKSDGS